MSIRKQIVTKSLAVLAVVALVSVPTIAGKKKEGIKGRYLEMESEAKLTNYRDAFVVVYPAEITADKDQPVDTEGVRSLSDDLLKASLESSGLFHSVVTSMPTENPEDRPILQLKTKLTLQYGSQAMRALVGSGAGKSKLHIRVHLSDAASGEPLGFYNGYGTGAGLWSPSGGGVQRMARDDFEENYAKFKELLLEGMK